MWKKIINYTLMGLLAISFLFLCTGFKEVTSGLEEADFSKFEENILVEL